MITTCILLTNYNAEFPNYFINMLELIEPACIITTTKGEKDFNRFDLHWRTDPKIVELFLNKLSSYVVPVYFDPTKERLVIQVDNVSNKETFFTIRN